MDNVLERLTEVLASIQNTQQQLLTQTHSQTTQLITKENLHPYEENSENFESYLQRLENHLALRGVDDSRPEKDKICVRILIGCLSPKVY